MDTRRIFSLVCVVIAGFICCILMSDEINFADDVPASPDVTLQSDGAQPDNQKSVLHILANQSELSMLTNLLKKAGLNPVLEKVEYVTIAAPTNTAFDKWRAMIGDDAYNRIINDKAQLQKILEHHIILDKKSMAQMTNDETLPTLHGGGIEVHNSPGGIIRLNSNSNIIPQDSDIDTGKAIIHAVDEVILPAKFE